MVVLFSFFVRNWAIWVTCLMCSSCVGGAFLPMVDPPMFVCYIVFVCLGSNMLGILWLFCALCASLIF